MSKIAFMFSGQGAQYQGMGQDLIENYNAARVVFKTADDALGFSISEIIQNEPEKLNETEYAQPAIFTMCAAIIEVLKEKNIKPHYSLGLSLGEYAALYEANSLSFTDGVKLVNRRGKYMSSVVPTGVGSMAAILGMGQEDLQKVCNEVSGICEIANYNCPGQLVIGGEKDSIVKACELALEAGARRAIELKVSGPFHTSMLKEAGELLFKDLENVEITKPNKPVVMNVTGEFYKDENIKELMKNQVSNSVMFEKSINTLIAEGVDTFIEIGPGKVLSGFVKKIDRSLNIFNIEDMKTLEKTLEKIGE